jgi:hypothetical protein
MKGKRRPQLSPTMQEAFRVLRSRYPGAKIMTDGVGGVAPGAALTVRLAEDPRSHSVVIYGPDTPGNDGQILIADTIYVFGATVAQAIAKWDAARKQ